MTRDRLTHAQLHAMDRAIDAAIARQVDGLPLPLLVLPKLYAAGASAALSGQDIDQAICAAIIALQQVR
jgi:hypothetical protein